MGGLIEGFQQRSASRNRRPPESSKFKKLSFIVPSDGDTLYWCGRIYVASFGYDWRD